MFQKFSSEGYITGSFGKLTNDMNEFWCNKNSSKNLFNGFDRIFCPCDYNNFYGLQYSQLYMNGTYSMYNIEKTPSAHEAVMTGNASINFINEISSNDKPFMIWVGFHSPHYPAAPPEWYGDLFSNLTAPITPSYNVTTPGKHGFASTNPAFNNDTCPEFINELYRDRLRTLIQVDDYIGVLYDTLSNNNILDDTYVIFSSDHGYHLGQYRIPCSKEEPYDYDIRIPISIAGPNIKKGIISNEIVGNIDYLPTMLDLANITYNASDYDGKSWANFILNGNNDNYNRNIYLTQYKSVGTYGFDHCQTWFSLNGSTFPGQLLDPPAKNADGEPWLVDDTQTNNWRAIRILNETMNQVYIEFYNENGWNDNGFKNPIFYEYYNINIDPHQLNNTYNQLSTQIKNELHNTLYNIGNCKGSNCFA